jgi:hypothetical protein
MRIELGFVHRHARKGAGSALLVALTTWFAPLAARADAVSDWNTIAITAAVTNAGRPAAAPIIDLAYVHAAIYDAVNAIDGRHSVYAVTPATRPAGASPEAATAAAAHATLLGLFPTQQPYLDGVYATYLASIPDGPAKVLGIAVGSEVAAAFLVTRSGDGRNAVVPYVFGSGPGVYQLTPGANPAVTPLVPWVAKMVPFTLESPSQFRAPGPPDLSSAQWAEDFNETKAYGALNGSLRTPEQTEIGQFYLENPGIQASRNIRGIAAAQGLSLADSARYFAQTYLTAADALITCWDSKFYFNFWRPVTAIRAGDTDGNDATEADPTWAPLGTTPGHPEYPAAHGCLTGAIAFVAADFFGTKNLGITFTSTSVPGVPLAEHQFTNTQGIVREITNARIYGGMHYRTSAEHGIGIARNVSRFVSKNFFQPLDDDHGCGHRRRGGAHCRAHKKAGRL